MNIPLEVEIAKDIVGGLTFIGGIGYSLFRLGRTATMFEMVAKQQTLEIATINTKIDKLAEQNSRIDRMDERQVMQGKRLDELLVRFNRLSDGK